MEVGERGEVDCWWENGMVGREEGEEEGGETGCRRGESWRGRGRLGVLGVGRGEGWWTMSLTVSDILYYKL